ncbi:hypothetical protein ACF07D_07540 [Leucobacter sp. NPDC015123]|uniref:hypothetical protein n=1 Tax=Leucobacter sp. NPDC015123 TaxID=3364129 RepID=UPI0036F4963A
MRVQISETTPTPAHAVKCGDRVRERGTGEVREVVGLGGTITRRIFTLDDGTYLEAGVLDTMFVTRAKATPTERNDDD